MALGNGNYCVFIVRYNIGFPSIPPIRALPSYEQSMCSCCPQFEWPRSFAQFQREVGKMIVGCKSGDVSRATLPCSICSMEIPNILRKQGILLCSSCAKDQGSIDSSTSSKSHVYLPSNYKLQSRAPHQRSRITPSEIWWLKFWAVCISIGVSLLPIVFAIIYIRYR